MVRIKTLSSLGLAVLVMLGAFVAQKIDANREADAQARQRASDQLQKDAAEALRLERLKFESDFAEMIPPERRLKIEVASGLESVGIRLIVDIRIVRNPPQVPAGQGDGSEYPMNVQLQAPEGGYFAVRCNSADCVFSPKGEVGAVIRGKLFAIPGDGCIYSTTEITGISAKNVRTAHCLKNGSLESADQGMKGSNL